MGIKKEDCLAVAKILYKAYYKEQIIDDKKVGRAFISKNQFAADLANSPFMKKGFSTYRMKEWEKAMYLFGYLDEVDLFTYEILLPQEEGGNE